MIIFHKIRNINILEIILSIQLQYTDFLHKPMFVSVYRTVTVSVQSVWSIVLYVKILLHFLLQCRTDTLGFPNLSDCMQQSYCLIHSSFAHSGRSEISLGTNVSQEHVYKIFFHIEILSLNVLGSNGEFFFCIALIQHII